MTPLCKDCRWAEHFVYRWCTNPKVVPPSRVDGGATQRCAIARDEYEPCGPEGRLFEQKLEPKPKPKPRWKIW